MTNINERGFLFYRIESERSTVPLLDHQSARSGAELK